MSEKGFLAFDTQDEALSLLRYAHSEGMEGHLLTLKAVEDPSQELYGVQMSWPDHWTRFEIETFIGDWKFYTKDGWS